MRMLGLLLVVLALFGLIVFVSLRVLDYEERQIFVGYLSVVSLISMFASPLFIIVSSCRTCFHTQNSSHSSRMCFNIYPFFRNW